MKYLRSLDWGVWRTQMYYWLRGLMRVPIPKPPIDWNKVYKIEDEIKRSCNHPLEARYSLCMYCGDSMKVGVGETTTNASNKTEFIKA